MLRRRTRTWSRTAFQEIRKRRRIRELADPDARISLLELDQLLLFVSLVHLRVAYVLALLVDTPVAVGAAEERATEDSAGGRAKEVYVKARTQA